MRHIWMILILLAGLLAVPDVGHACSCAEQRSVAESLEKSAAVFSGKVLSVEKRGLFQPHELEVEIEVIDAWKGVGQSRVKVRTAEQSASCGFAFQEGQEYLVYATNGDGKGLSTNLCSRTTELAVAQEDLAQLGEPKIVKCGVDAVPGKRDSFQVFATADGPSWGLFWALVLPIVVLAAVAVYVERRKRKN